MATVPMGLCYCGFSKHTNFRYAFYSQSVSRQVNQQTFRHFTKLDSDFYEVEHSKRQTVFNMPIHSQSQTRVTQFGFSQSFLRISFDY